MAIDDNHYFQVQGSNVDPEGYKGIVSSTFENIDLATAAFEKFHTKYVWLMEWGKFKNAHGEEIEDWITFKWRPTEILGDTPILGNGCPASEWGSGRIFEYQPLARSAG